MRIASEAPSMATVKAILLRFRNVVVFLSLFLSEPTNKICLSLPWQSTGAKALFLRTQKTIFHTPSRVRLLEGRSDIQKRRSALDTLLQMRENPSWTSVDHFPITKGFHVLSTSLLAHGWNSSLYYTFVPWEFRRYDAPTCFAIRFQSNQLPVAPVVIGGCFPGAL